jgi:FkbM family methyltransferase
VISYAQNAEDVVLARAFEGATAGFYIDVGAAHPDYDSTTRHFYEAGWHGINIEPLPDLFDALEFRRSRDININAGLSDVSGYAVFYHAVEAPGLSTFDPDVAEQLTSEGRAVVSRTMQVTTLAEVCSRYVVGAIDFLKLDVEGLEGNVIRGADWSVWRPRIVVVEANNVETWEKVLLDAGYHFALFDGINRFYAPTEEHGLLDRLRSPACVLDDFIPAPLARRIAELEDAVAALQAPVVKHPPPSGTLHGNAHRLRCLQIISSANQLYSGIGRNAFELTKRLRRRCEITFLIDDGLGRNVDVLRAFVAENDLNLILAEGVPSDAYPDVAPRQLEEIIEVEQWDVIEAVSWANAGTNAALLRADPAVPIVYTPHYQPTWTIPLSDRQAREVEATHRAMLARADAIFCDSRWERDVLSDGAERPSRFVHLPIGCDFEKFHPSLNNPRQALAVLCVGDYAEPRKRFERIAGAFIELAGERPDASLIVVGNSSTAMRDHFPNSLRSRVRTLGYVSEETLIRLYQESAVFLNLSDYEAFGMPILEALACDTVVVLHHQAVLESVFGALPGVRFVDGDDSEACAQAMLGSIERRDAISTPAERLERLRMTFDWNRISDIKWDVMATLAGRHHQTRGATAR